MKLKNCLKLGKELWS